MPEYVVEARGLVKRFRETVAVNGVDLFVERGRVYGALGPNGSGKSTTVRMLLGLARPNEGEVKLFGRSIADNGPELFRRVGAVVETPAFVPYLSGRDNLRLLEKYTPGAGERGIEIALDRVHLLHAAHRRFKNYSLGMKQRLGIAAAILHDPELIVLDEPTNGLDPQGTREVRALIPELAAEGRTIVLCSHLLYEVEQVCDAVAIFQRGEIVAQGDTKTLIGTRSTLHLRAPDINGIAAALAESRWKANVRRDGDELVIDDAGHDGAEVNRFLAAGGHFVAELRQVVPTLEDFFFKVTDGEREV